MFNRENKSVSFDLINYWNLKGAYHVYFRNAVNALHLDIDTNRQGWTWTDVVMDQLDNICLYICQRLPMCKSHFWAICRDNPSLYSHDTQYSINICDWSKHFYVHILHFWMSKEPLPYTRNLCKCTTSPFIYLFILVHNKNQLLKMSLYLKCMFQWLFFTVFDLDKGVELMHDTLNERCCSVKKIKCQKNCLIIYISSLLSWLSC